MKNDFATKADLKHTAEALHRDISAVRTDLTKTENGLRQEIVKFRDDLHQEIIGFKDDLHQEIIGFKNDLHQEIIAVREDLHKEIVEVNTGLNQKIDSVNVSLKKDIDCLAVQVIHVSTELGDLKRELVDFKQETGERFDGVMTAIDGLAGLLQNGRTEKAAVDHALGRHDAMLDDHESRIGVLEGK